MSRWGPRDGPASTRTVQVSLSAGEARQVVVDVAKEIAGFQFFTHVSHRHVGYDVGRRMDRDRANVNVILEAHEGGTQVQVTSRMLPLPFLSSRADPTAVNEANVADIVDALQAAGRSGPE